MSKIHTDLSPSSLVAALEADLYSIATTWAHLLEGELHEAPACAWFSSKVPYSMFNGVIRAQFFAQDADTRIDEILNYFAQRHVPMAWLVSPSSQPVDLAERLQAHGLALDEEGIGMALDLQTLPEQTPSPVGLTIQKVTDLEMLHTWIRILTIGSGFPPSVDDLLSNIANRHSYTPGPLAHYYLGFFNGEPVATSLLHLGAGVAGIYCVSTIPSARCQGIGNALTALPLLEARTLGYRIGALQSSPMGHNVYLRLGFKEYCTFRFYFR